MNQRKDKYRAALQRGEDTAAPRCAKVTTLHSRYVRVTIEVDPDLPRNLTRWAGPPVSALVLTGATFLRNLADTAAKVPDPSPGPDGRSSRRDVDAAQRDGRREAQRTAGAQ